MIIFAVAIPVGLTLRYKNTSVSDFFNSDSMRIQIWKDCFEMFLKNPILGLGAGTDNIHTLLRDTYGIINRTHAHNLFLEMLVEGGIIGGIFVISLLFILIKNLVKLFKLKDKKYKSYAFLYTASLLSFLVMSMSEFTLQSAKELMIFFILLGFVEATFRMATDSTQPAQDEIIIKEQLKETIEV
jgi:O-antigen ligase